MNKIIGDIEEIVELVKRVEAHLSKSGISKAKSEIKAIASIDIDEYARIKEEFGDKRLLEQCILVLRAAKKALRELDSLELTNDVKALMDKIVQIESHELLEVNEDERKENELYNFWHEHYFKAVVYHGTTSLAVDKIKRYGLVPGMYPWEKHDLDRFVQLAEKAGPPVFPWVEKYRMEITQFRFIYLAGNKRGAIDYATALPETISSIFRPKTFKTNDTRRALQEAYSILIYGAVVRNRFTNSQAGEILNLIYSDKAKFLRWAIESTKLTRAEINEFERIFFSIWYKFKEHRPVVLTISVQAPPVLAQLPECRNFKDFLKRYGSFLNKISDNPYKHTALDVKERIPAKYILNIEYAD